MPSQGRFFDDGYSSFYTRVWPLLKAYNVPALWAPVGSWVDTPPDKKVDFGGLMTARDKFATWEMVRELSRSPLVEIGPRDIVQIAHVSEAIIQRERQLVTLFFDDTKGGAPGRTIGEGASGHQPLSASFPVEPAGSLPDSRHL